MSAENDRNTDDVADLLYEAEVVQAKAEIARRFGRHKIVPGLTRASADYLSQADTTDPGRESAAWTHYQGVCPPGRHRWKHVPANSLNGDDPTDPTAYCEVCGAEFEGDECRPRTEGVSQ